MYKYEIELSELEYLAMQYVCMDINEWVQNAVHDRARIAIEQVINDAIKEFLDRGESIPGSKEEIIQLAYDREYLRPLSVITQEELANNTPVIT